MAELSFLWTTGGAGDGASTYTRTDWRHIMHVVAACMDEEGIAPGHAGALAPSTTGANNARVTTGAALVDGKPYVNGAVVDVVIPSASGGGNTRIDRIVLRADWSAQTVRITRIAGTDAASPTAPAITQSSTSVWDTKICQALVDTGGTVTITDERTLATPATGVLTADMIANRTRTLFVPATGGRANSDATDINRASIPGWVLTDGQIDFLLGGFSVPSDFVSGMTIAAVVMPAGTGNLYARLTAYYGAAGEAYGNHSDAVGLSAVAVTANQIKLVHTVTPSSVAAGDYFQLEYYRDANSATDTVSNTVYLMGWLVSYTADS